MLRRTDQSVHPGERALDATAHVPTAGHVSAVRTVPVTSHAGRPTPLPARLPHRGRPLLARFASPTPGDGVRPADLTGIGPVALVRDVTVLDPTESGASGSSLPGPAVPTAEPAPART